ncbi:MAG: hypothetical protein ABI330_01735 [Caldimonas sp.]
MNLDSHYDVSKSLQLFARINNVFDRRYANLGILGDNYFTGPGQQFAPNQPQAEQFRGYGAPRGGWVGMQYTFE